MRMRGKWGSLLGVSLLGVGLVLFLLGFDGHTTEALPFGVAGLVAGAVIAWPSFRALRGAIREASGAGPVSVSAAALQGEGAPTSVTCTSCGARARLRLDRPTHADCEHCGARLALEPDLARRLTAAAAAVKAQSQAERQLSDVIRALPEREAALRSRLVTLTWALCGLALLGAPVGYLRRAHDDMWHGFVLFALAAVPAAALLGAWCVRALPRAVWGIVSHWTALQLPGARGLACRACGAPLPEGAAAVLRCEFCGSDNLASAAVVARVAQGAALTQHAVLGAQRQSRSADELAAFSVRSFPTIVLLTWFAIGAASGGVLGRALHELPVSPPAELRYALVEGAVAGVTLEGQGARLFFDAETSRVVEVAPPTLTAEQLVGLRLVTGEQIARVWSRLGAPLRPCATTSAGATLYLPGPWGGGERIAVSP